MSMAGGISTGTGETGYTIATFPTYEAAQKVVSRLIAAEIPAKHVAIVGRGLRSVERVTGRLGYAAAARSGALNGVLLGLLFAFIFVVGDATAPVQAFIGIILIGVAIGILLSLIMYSFLRRRRDFASVMQVVADSYEVTVEQVSIHKARAALGATSSAPSAPVTAIPPADTRTVQPQPERPSEPPAEQKSPTSPSELAPPQYGERITPPEKNRET